MPLCPVSGIFKGPASDAGRFNLGRVIFPYPKTSQVLSVYKSYGFPQFAMYTLTVTEDQGHWASLMTLGFNFRKRKSPICEVLAYDARRRYKNPLNLQSHFFTICTVVRVTFIKRLNAIMDLCC